MGLDCTSYSNCEFIIEGEYDSYEERGTDPEGNPINGKLFKENNYTTVYEGEYEPRGGMKPGIYSYVGEYDWCAGSYQGYSLWREYLAYIAGYTPAVLDTEAEQMGGINFVIDSLNNEQLRKVLGADCPPRPNKVEGQVSSYMAGAWQAKEGAFIELLDFSDSNGTLTTEQCANLLEAFKTHDEKAKEFQKHLNGKGEQGDWFYDLYEKWWSACDMAANGGFISFH